MLSEDDGHEVDLLKRITVRLKFAEDHQIPAKLKEPQRKPTEAQVRLKVQDQQGATSALASIRTQDHQVYCQIAPSLLKDHHIREKPHPSSGREANW